MKMSLRLYIFLVLNIAFWFPSISQPFEFKAVMTDFVNLQNIPSASGIVAFQDGYYVIGDDSPYLFKLNTAFVSTDSIRLMETKHEKNGRVSGKHKADFECATVVPWGNDEDILVFGSGSGEKRKVMVRIDIDDDRAKVETYSLKKLYKQLAKRVDGKVNIEGACYWEGKLILLNRSTNTLFLIDFEEFSEYVKGKDKDTPKIETVAFKLPVVNGMSARFSGATVFANSDMMLFTASVENSPNWINEDNIIGSYLGMIDLKQLENNEPVCAIIEAKNKPIREKVESVFVTEHTDKTIKLVGVTDNDDGTSRLLKLEFQKR